MITGSQTQIEDQQYVSQHLLPHENILWTGRPPTGILFRKSDAFLIPFSLLWGGFAVVWEYTAYNSGAPSFFLLFGGVFVIIGLFMIFGRFVYDKWVRENTVYAVTNERALIFAGLFSQSLKALNLKNQSQISLDMSSDGKGTITFGTTGGLGFVVNNSSWPGSRRVSLPMFESIDNASEVYKLIQSNSK